MESATQSIHEVSVIVPVYNEASNIRSVLEHLDEALNSAGFLYEIIVVNDGSTDGSSEALRESAVRIRLIEHSSNKGYGAALKSGIREADYNLVVLTDGDGTYPHEAIPQVLREINDKDMVVGARVGKDVRIPLVRKPAKWVLNQLANYLSGTKIPDLNSGLRAIRKNVFQHYFHLLPDGFSFTTTITLALMSDGYRIGYVPISYYKRTGKSKIRPLRDTINFLQLIIRTVLYFNPLKVFVPVSLGLVGLSFLLFLYRVLVGKGFGVTIVILFLAGVQLLAVGMIADLIVRRMKWRS